MLPTHTVDDPGPSTIPDAWSSMPQPPKRHPQSKALTTAAHVWLGQLPPRYQPLATARLHPHVVNRLCELWRTPQALPAYVRELLLSSRPTEREGFAFEVLTELADLQNLVDEMLQRRPDA